ncbi:MAG: AbiV family abortive infection protein [Micromonosporaceae bacterium]
MAETLDAGLARRWWRALTENSVGLLEDSACLLTAGSAGRARSLQVLAMEELAKALWIYEDSEDIWSSGGVQVRLADDFEKAARSHLSKLAWALTADSTLEVFWGDYSSRRELEDLSPEGLAAFATEMFEAYKDSARALNKTKQAGLYVDRVGEELHLPADVPADGLADEIVRTARVALMLLIQDHSRMKEAAGQSRYDSTHDLQNRLMALGYPDEVSPQPSEGGDSLSDG